MRKLFVVCGGKYVKKLHGLCSEKDFFVTCDYRTKNLIENTYGISSKNIYVMNRVRHDKEVVENAYKSFETVKKLSKEFGIPEVLERIGNEYFFYALIPLSSYYMEVKDYINNNRIDKIYIIGGNPRSHITVIFNGLAESMTNALFFKEWMVAPYLYKKLSQEENITISWINKENHHLLSSVIYLRRLLFFLYRFLSNIKYILKSGQFKHNAEKSVKDEYGKIQGDAFIVRADASLRYLASYATKKSISPILVIDYSRLPRDLIYNSDYIKVETSLSLKKYFSKLFDYLKIYKMYKKILNKKLSSIKKNEDIIELREILKEFFTLLPDISIREVLFENYKNTFKNIKISNIYTTETFAYGVKIHKNFAQSISKKLNLLQVVTLQPIVPPINDYDKLITYSKEIYKIFKDSGIEVEYVNYIPRYPINLKLENDSCFNILILTQPDEYVEIFRDVLDVLYKSILNSVPQRLRRDIRILIKPHPRDSVGNYREVIRKIKRISKLEIENNLERAICRSDMVLCSTTSTLYDLANIKKSVISYIPNKVMLNNPVIKELRNSSGNIIFVESKTELERKIIDVIKGHIS